MFTNFLPWFTERTPSLYWPIDLLDLYFYRWAVNYYQVTVEDVNEQRQTCGSA